ncbi:zinc finger protein 1-like [Octopus sinensis]|uniref:Zinc finger protein 1-like n=1 Tax=Octopus sinensis TaxID=2607531 RepID=A0A6P7TCW1_9MOLL|nr:zinc finger protein 1-like [Octopus sinensis]
MNPERIYSDGMLKDGKMLYNCDVCKKSFSQKHNLTSHKCIHTGEKPNHCGEKPFYCDVCGKSFSAKCILTKHRRIHTGEKPYHCNICEYKKKWEEECLVKKMVNARTYV